jgi:hypothetical protein
VSNPPRVNGLRRRRFLAAGALAAAASAVPLAAGCTPDSAKPKPPDPLAALASRARADAALATAIGTAHPELAAQTKAVADNRTQHAQAIEQEVRRANPPETTATSASPPPRTTSPVSPPSSVALTTLAEALRAAAREAADLVPVAPRYRAGLLGSVAAGCTALQEVLT